MRAGVAIAITAVAVAAAGCGRIGFDEHSGGGPGDGPILGGDGPLPIACTPTAPAELCNGIDDNCDQRVDEGCPCSPIDTTVTETPSSYTHALLWTGTGLVQIE